MTCPREGCILGGGHNGPCSYTREPVPLKDILKRIGQAVGETALEKLKAGDQWRRWAIKALNRIDLQDATAEELQRAIEERMK